MPQPNDQVLVAMEKTNHTYHLGTCFLLGPAGEKIEGLRTWRTSHLSTWQRFSTFILCKKPCVAIGTVGPSVSCSELKVHLRPMLTVKQPLKDLEAQSLRETQFESLVKNETLTRGYERPSSLVDSADMFTRALPSFQVKLGTGKPASSERHALVVALEFDKSRFSVIILFVAMLGLVMGCGIGAATRDWELGAGIGGSLFAFVAVLQGTMILMYL